ncbi:radical SAM protein, partial [bacterium]|nr:radical SAM protein [bacterium]
AGHREVVLTGVHLGYWGKEFGQTLSDLLRELLTVPGLGRIRLSSMEPQELTNELLTLIAGSEGRMAPHLHVPLQSGSNAVLHAMRRGYRLEQAMERMAAARRLIPNLGLGLDVLTSFPGETKADFNATLHAARECGASYLHVFSYSPRPGTPAADYPGQLSPEVKKERSRLARRLSRQLAMEYAQTQVGKELSVLVERHRAASGRLLGVAGNYLRCELLNLPDDQAGRLITTRVIEPLNEPVHGPAKVLCRQL